MDEASLKDEIRDAARYRALREKLTTKSANNLNGHAETGVKSFKWKGAVQP